MAKLLLKDDNICMDYNPDNVVMTRLVPDEFMVRTVEGATRSYNIPGEISEKNAKKFIFDVDRGRRR